MDVGGGNGVLARELAEVGVLTVTADRARYVADAPPPVLRSDALMLPFREGSFSGAAALWVLYHLVSPQSALAEYPAVPAPGRAGGGLRPEPVQRPRTQLGPSSIGQPLSFDAENGPVQVATVFGDVEVEAWDEPMVSLSGPADVALFLRGRGLSEGHARSAAERFEAPLTVTKRGMLAWARK